MSLFRRSWIAALFSAVLFGTTPTLQGANVTLQGAFSSDDSVQLFDVFLNATANVDFRTYGYAGGTASNGASIPRGGFDPILTLFDSNGIFIVENDDGAGVADDALTQQPFDARITRTLNSGQYILAVTQYDNFVLGLTLAEGFEETGHANFTADPSFSSGPGCPSGLFRDSSETTGACRNGSWTVDFVNVASATPRAVNAVPEPSTTTLLLLGSLFTIGTIASKRRCF